MKTIFVSSTFRDMHFERDAIQEHVMPRINESARKYGESVSFCDLRWGINTDDLESEAGSRKVLDVCLDEIDRCQPPMVVILGDRYGWIPDRALIQTVAEHKQMQLDSLRKSVTALEVEYGALSKNRRSEKTLFYFREFDSPWPEGFEEEDAEHAALLKELKNRILRLTDGKIRHYKVRWENGSLTGIDTFTDLLTADLEELLLPQWEDFNKMSPHQKEMHTHWTFVREKAGMFRARKATAATMLETIRGSKEPIILQGASGLGKSTLLSYLATQLEPDHQVIPLICGLTPKSNTAMGILQTVVFSLEELLNTDYLSQEQDAGEKEKTLSTKQWLDRLNSLCNECTAAQKHVVILVDAADQLLEDPGRENLIFIPDSTSQYVHFVMTCLPELPLQGRSASALHPILEAEKRLIITGMLEAKNRELSTPVILAILDKPASNIPLYLSLLVQRLLMMNKEDFEAISDLGNDMAAITEYQIQLVAACPDDLSSMSVELLQVTGQRINGPMIESVAQLISTSRYGLRQQDLAALLKDSFNSLDFAHFISYMSDCFLLRSDGRYDFSHKSIRAGFRALTTQHANLHSKLYNYLSSLPETDDIRIQERGYHCVQLQDGDKLRNLITELYETGKNIGKEPLSKALVHFCMENDTHIHWVKNLLVFWGDTESDLSMTRFLSNWLLPEFQETSVDPVKIRSLYSENYTLAQQVHERLITQLSGISLADAGDAYAAYCHRRKDPANKQLALQIRKDVVVLAEALAESFHNVKTRTELAHAYRMLAWSCADSPDDTGPEMALGYYSKALTICQELNEEISTPATSHSLAIAYDDIANLYNTLTFTPLNAAERKLTMNLQPVCQKQHREYAAELYSKALDLRKKLVEEDPSIQNRRNLAYSYRSLATLHEHQPETGQLKLVIQYLEQEEAILQSLYAEDRQIFRATDLASCLKKLGDALFSSGHRIDLPEAFRRYHAAKKLRQTVYAALPTSQNLSALISARSDSACTLFLAGTEQYLQEAYREFQDIYNAMISNGSDINDHHFQQCLFYLSAIAEKLGQTPPPYCPDITTLPFFRQAYTYAEFLEFADYLEDDMIDMIPTNMMYLIRKYALPGYRRHFSDEIPPEDQDMEKKTLALLTVLTVQVWSTTQSERDELFALLEENSRQKQHS